MSTPFEQRRAHILSSLQDPQGPDRSPKGGVDTAILPLLTLINSHADYVSTSSCSGRISVFHQCNSEIKEEVVEYNNSVAPKDRWVLVSHDPVEDVESTARELYAKLQAMVFQPAIGNKQSVLFRFEPFLLHIEVKDLQAGQHLASLAYQQGLRLTGILPGKQHIIVSIRSTMIMDAPLWYNGKLLVNEEYLVTLLNLANDKFALNTSHMSKFYKAIEEDFQKPKSTKEPYQHRTAPAGITTKTNTNKEPTGLDVTDFGDDFALMAGVEGE